MEMKLSSGNRFRVLTNVDNFIDIAGIKDGLGMVVDSYPRFQYMEIRKKEGFLRTFYFNRKSSKKSFDFEWWEDAEVVFAINNVKH